MGRRKQPERVTVGEFIWERLPDHEWPLGAVKCERWQLLMAGISVRVTNFGEGDDPYRSGWRVVAGAPEKQKYETRDLAMAGATEVIQREARLMLERAKEQMRFAHEVGEATGVVPRRERA